MDDKDNSYPQVVESPILIPRSTKVETGCEPYMGMEFDTVDDAWHFWINYSGRMGFDVRRHWSNKNKSDGTISSMRFVCNKEGTRRKDQRDILTKCPRAETRTNCLCRMGISLNKQVKRYTVHDLVLEHNHLLHIPETVHMMSSQRKISEVQAMEIDLADDEEVDSVANVIFEKVKGFFNCHPQGVMNNNNFGYRPIDTNELYDQELHHNGLSHLSQASNLSYNDFAMESGSQWLNSQWGQAM